MLCVKASKRSQAKGFQRSTDDQDLKSRHETTGLRRVSCGQLCGSSLTPLSLARSLSLFSPPISPPSPAPTRTPRSASVCGLTAPFPTSTSPHVRQVRLRHPSGRPVIEDEALSVEEGDLWAFYASRSFHETKQVRRRRTHLGAVRRYSRDETGGADQPGRIAPHARGRAEKHSLARPRSLRW
jgi:hypothetical protein